MSQGGVNLLARLYREFFRALANPTRFAVVQLLRTEPHNVGQIGEKLGLEQSRVSHNLACLLNCGFVEWEWRGGKKGKPLQPPLWPPPPIIPEYLPPPHPPPPL